MSGSGAMLDMAAMAGPGYVAWLFLMWAVMMAAMMLPTAMPMALMFVRLSGDRAGVARTLAGFILGYLVVWAGFSAGATALHWGLEAGGLVTRMEMRLASAWAIGAVLAVAGVWQLTPLKDACLARCRSPIGFLLSEWRPGLAGATVMGLRHGLFCVGCCWALMALLFAGGVMNIAVIALLTLYMLAEKTIGVGRGLSRAAGVAMIAGGAGLALFA